MLPFGSHMSVIGSCVRWWRRNKDEFQRCEFRIIDLEGGGGGCLALRLAVNPERRVRVDLHSQHSGPAPSTTPGAKKKENRGHTEPWQRSGRQTSIYRGTSLIRNSTPSWDNHMTLGQVLL